MEPRSADTRRPSQDEAARKKANARRRERRRLDALLAVERGFLGRGFARIAGVDEAGVGPLAGPVVAAAVILPDGTSVRGAKDSKLLPEPRRTELDAAVRACAIAVGIGVADVEEIERWNIYQAGLLAMRRALDALPEPPGLVLLDARTLPNLPWPQEARIKADASIHCVACASILAKVYRDRLMLEYDLEWPQYGFAKHKGYATAAHRRALQDHGPCAIHRRSFLGNDAQLELFDRAPRVGATP